MKMMGFERLKKQRLIVYKSDHWITAYFKNTDFQASEFINDLQTFDESLKTAEIEEIAIKQFAYQICTHVFSGKNLDIEGKMLSLFTQDIDESPLWETIKEVLTVLVTSMSSGTMQGGIYAYSD